MRRLAARTDDIVSRWRNVTRRVALAGALAAVTVCSSPLHAQTDDAVEKRLQALESATREIQSQLMELTRILVQTLPPPKQLPQSPVETVHDMVLPLAGVQTKGDARAPLVFVELADFQCPFCGRYAQDIYPQIQRDFVDTGRIVYAFRNLPIEEIHPLALKAAEAAECAGYQGKFWEMHDMLFKRQPQLTPRDLSDYAEAVGLDRTSFGVCLSGQATAQVKKDETDMARLGLTSTPTFLIGTVEGANLRVMRKIVGSQSYSVFKSVIQSLLIQMPH